MITGPDDLQDRGPITAAELAELLVGIRRRKGTAVATLARRSGVSECAIRGYFRGDYLTTIENVAKLLDAMGHELSIKMYPATHASRDNG